MGRFSFPMAPGRAEALGEIHARPFALVGQSRVIFQLAFLTDGGAVVDHAVLAELARARGVAVPGRDAAHFAMAWGQGCAGSGIRNFRPISGMRLRQHSLATMWKHIRSVTSSRRPAA